MKYRSGLVAASFLTVIHLTLAGDPATAELYINEIFWDAGGSTGDDERDEYIELRGTPEMPLTDHYLIFLENEDDSSQSGDTGKVDGFFDLGSFSMGTNGFLVLRQKGNLYDTTYGVAPGTGGGVNAGGDGWGNNFTDPGSSTVGFYWEPSDDGQDDIENGGFTAMLIDKGEGPAPMIGMELDGNVNNDNAELVDGFDPTPHDGLDFPGEGQEGWTILDSIGVHTEATEPVFGRTYAQINFGTIRIGELLGEVNGEPLFFHPNIEPDATYVGIHWPGREIEYLGRWGDSTGQSAYDWHASNLTEREQTGSAGAPDFRQSVEDPHASNSTDPIEEDQRTESTHWVQYRTPLLNTLGSSNYPFNLTELPWDYNGDGSVNAADYTVWRDTFGEEGPDLAADGDGDHIVDMQDYDAWKFHFGLTLPGGGAGAGSLATGALPEPASCWIVITAVLSLPRLRRR